jgi:hypothetical protein
LGVPAQHKCTKVAGQGRTYDDAREADEREHEGHVGLGGGDAAPRFERINGLSAAQDPREQQALQKTKVFVSLCSGVRKCVSDDGHWTRPTRATPARRSGGSVGRVCAGGEATCIRAHAGVVLLRGLLCLYGVVAAHVGAYDRCPVLEVVGRFVVERIGVGFLCDHLNVHARLRVLDDSTQVHLSTLSSPFVPHEI